MSRRSLLILLGFAAFAVYVVAVFNQLGRPVQSHNDMAADAAGAHPGTDLPATWEGMALAGVARGPDALAEINRLHGKEIAVHTGLRAEYASAGERLTLWVAHVESAAAAGEMVDQMTRSMAAGQTPFTPPAPAALGTTAAWRTEGMGQVHFYYALENRVYWLAIRSPRAPGLAAAAAARF